ncbi:MAG: class I SAM-dependent methyltransferase [bacterium]
MSDLPDRIESHYTYRGLVERIREALGRAGLDFETLSWENLSPLDEFHPRGRRATAELARFAGVDTGMHVLDIGCGVGGPARYLAGEYGCSVTGIDITAEFCRAATALAEWTGMGGRVEYRQADAAELPFADSSFDMAWMQQVATNIRDKPALFREVRRVLRPGRRFAFHEALSGSNGDLVYPVPWARDGRMNFLISPDDMRQLAEAEGFAIAKWEDVTADARRWFEKVIARIKDDGPPVLGLHLLLGPEMSEMSANMLKNIELNRITLVRALLVSPAVPRHS